MSAFEDKVGAGAGPAVDPLWDAVYGHPLGDGAESEQQEFDPVPRIDHGYCVKFESVEGRLVGEAAYPTLHFSVRITAGPSGSVNRVLWDDVFLVPFKRKDEVDMTPATERLRALLTRFRNHLKLGQERPMGSDVESLTIYGRQFIGKDAVVGIKVEGERTDKETGRVYDARNRIIWEGLGAPDAPVYDKKTKQPTGQTYAQRAADEVAAYEAKAAGGGGSRGKKAGSALGAAAPTDFFGGGGAAGG